VVITWNGCVNRFAEPDASAFRLMYLKRGDFSVRLDRLKTCPTCSALTAAAKEK
jgi:hypothetical protein